MLHVPSATLRSPYRSRRRFRHTCEVSLGLLDVVRGHQRRRKAVATIEIGRALDLTIVAEGIETDEERSSLLALGYAFGQGYLFSRAIPAAEALRAGSTPFMAAPAPAGAVAHP